MNRECRDAENAGAKLHHPSSSRSAALERLRLATADPPQHPPSHQLSAEAESSALDEGSELSFAELNALAKQLGFVRIAVTSGDELPEARESWQSWLDGKYHGEMSYLAEGERASPSSLLRCVKSVICVALPYATPAAEKILADVNTEPATRQIARRSGRPSARALPNDEATGAIAAYAQGLDYHPVLWNKLLSLADELANLLERPVLARPCVDTAPLLERAMAERAGLGFIGKNGLLIAPGAGSFFVLGELLVDVELPRGNQIKSRCGTCEACLEACPTQAFIGPYELNAQRCISYLTIELKGSIPRELRRPIGTRIFGCDICQSICPFNSSARPRPPVAELTPAREGIQLVELLELGAAQYRKIVKKTALRRVSKAQLARNAAIGLGNLGRPEYIPHLIRALQTNPSACVREHAAWALGQLLETPLVAPALQSAAQESLENAAKLDEDRSVREEAERILYERSQSHTRAVNSSEMPLRSHQAGLAPSVNPGEHPVVSSAQNPSRPGLATRRLPVVQYG